MTFWQHLLSFIPGVRAAYQDAEASRKMALEASQRAVSLQSEITTLREIHSELLTRLDTALASERNAHQMVINVEYQQRYGFAPYPTAPMMPDSVKREMRVMGPEFISGRQVARTLEERARAEISNFFVPKEKAG